MNIFRLFLYPFGLLYGVVMHVRNKLYDWGVLKVTEFDFPVISVGNLSYGGTGKTPQVEYLIRLLGNDYKIATLSRGYKRHSKGFYLADQDSTVADIGDEALQISRKFRHVIVAVDEDRVHGIKEIKKRFPETEVVLLDDAFQHRSVKPGLSILLTDYHRLYPENHILPVGNLREFKGGYTRADVIIITKTPKPLSPLTVRRIAGLINPKPHQKLLFSYITSGMLTPLPGLHHASLPEKFSSALLFAGIENIYPLLDHVSKFVNNLEHLHFSDHHTYSEKDLDYIRERFNNLFAKVKIIITTEKDAARLAYPKLPPQLADLPVFYLPIETKIHNEYRKDFNDQIRKYVRENTGH
ncbi:MAG: tetraacyldisaccharide 4'-kinase [Bacteroidales bacterium]|nr:tetraacyldisaccharide 4'-kinase [Bacteroidales bacterium]